MAIMGHAKGRPTIIVPQTVDRVISLYSGEVERSFILGLPLVGLSAYLNAWMLSSNFRAPTEA
jgi:hypothetical protein